LRENLAVLFITPSSWGSQRAGHSTRHQLFSGAIIPAITLGGHFTKNTCFDPSGHLKMENAFFYVETEKTLVTKVVGNPKMHICTKYGTMVT
jgi:hypothetical protein